MKDSETNKNDISVGDIVFSKTGNYFDFYRVVGKDTECVFLRKLKEIYKIICYDRKRSIYKKKHDGLINKAGNTIHVKRNEFGKEYKPYIQRRNFDVLIRKGFSEEQPVDSDDDDILSIR